MVQALQNKLAGTSLVLVAGGHVAVLINRIRLFRLRGFIGTKGHHCLVCWCHGVK
ncbi:MAG: hypothetical protein R3E89_14245 [Thiolinea sp.]